jgi:hypothetical protein
MPAGIAIRNPHTFGMMDALVYEAVVTATPVFDRVVDRQYSGSGFIVTKSSKGEKGSPG